jgi:uncharacterized protein YndB with AHSA1/START domain
MNTITVSVVVNTTRAQAWNYFTSTAHIVHWNFASPDWECPTAENDLEVGGAFKVRMQAKDGSVGFDFEGIYTEVVEGSSYTYKLADGRTIHAHFEEVEGGTKITETFDPETENSEELQRAGWQAILENFKHYTERTKETGVRP